ncbi:MAG: polyhydroxyalkanoic acid system family protein [Deltaproteobacteria bacterium]
MATQKIERSYPGKTTQEIFERTRASIEQISAQLSLKHESDEAKRTGKVSRTGAEGRYRVEGERLTLELEFGFLVPGVVRKRVEAEVTGRLDRLFG